MADFYAVGNASFAPASGRNGSEAAPWIWGVDTIVGNGRWGGGDVLHLKTNTGFETLTGIFSPPDFINGSSSNYAVIDGTDIDLGSDYIFNVRSNLAIRGFKSIKDYQTGTVGGVAPVNFALVGIGEIKSNTNRSSIAFTEGHIYNARIARIGKISNTTTPQTNGTRAGVVWRPGTTVESSLNSVTIEDVHFEDYEAIRGVICFMTGVTDKNRVRDLIIRRITYKNVTGLPVDLELAGPDSGIHPSLKGTADWSTGIKVNDICGENVTCKIVNGTSFFGGLVFISGCGNSMTPGFGPNEVGPLYGKNLSGDAGLCDLLYGTYQGKVADFDHPDYPGLRGKSLWVDGLSSPNIDANALLFDVGCHDCYFPGIYAKNITGNPAKNNSGAVVMFLENATNCVATGIEFENVKCLLFIGASGSASSGCITNFTGTGIIDYGALVGSSATLADNIRLVNGSGEGSYGVRNERGAGNQWKGESNNFWRGSAAKNLNHTFSADSRIGVDPMIDPITRRPLPGSPLLRAAKNPGFRVRDAAGNRFRLPAAIGAYDDNNIQPRAQRV